MQAKTRIHNAAGATSEAIDATSQGYVAIQTEPPAELSNTQSLDWSFLIGNAYNQTITNIEAFIQTSPTNPTISFSPITVTDTELRPGEQTSCTVTITTENTAASTYDYTIAVNCDFAPAATSAREAQIVVEPVDSGD